MFEIGTVCVKIAGRDAGKQCVVVEELGQGMVLIEGETRRRKCNVMHLEPTGKASVKQGADHATVMKALGLSERTSKARKPAAKPGKKEQKAPAKKAPAKKAPAKKTAEKEE